ncbi:MAG: hypothetical protein LBB21_01265, partial [Holosporaceae bacterium]|nr:hypothetical protein [Holosporaceae bacterium]
FKTIKKRSKESTTANPKLDQLARIMYEGIVRCIKAKKAQDKEKKVIFALDSARKLRKDVL